MNFLNLLYRFLNGKQSWKIVYQIQEDLALENKMNGGNECTAQE